VPGSFRDGCVSYLVDTVFKPTPAHPYSTASPKALGCASWVRGSVTAG
jgi:hypothetical protein